GQTAPRHRVHAHQALAHRLEGGDLLGREIDEADGCGSSSRGAGSGSCGGRCPRLAHYVTGMGPMDGATAAGGRSCCLSSRRCPQSFPCELSVSTKCGRVESCASVTARAEVFERAPAATVHITPTPLCPPSPFRATRT